MMGIGVILMIVNLSRINYSDVLSRANLGEGFGLLSNLCLVGAMWVSFKYSQRKN